MAVVCMRYSERPCGKTCSNQAREIAAHDKVGPQVECSSARYTPEGHPPSNRCQGSTRLRTESIRFFRRSCARFRRRRRRRSHHRPSCRRRRRKPRRPEPQTDENPAAPNHKPTKMEAASNHKPTKMEAASNHKPTKAPPPPNHKPTKMEAASPDEPANPSALICA